MGQYANGKHVVYIPFTRASEELDAVANWNEWNSMTGLATADGNYRQANNPYKARRQFVAITESSPVIPADLNFAGSAQNVLYVLGHCDSGDGSLSASEGGESVDSRELAQRVARLIGNNTFPGGIKVYGCKSATSGFLSVSFAHAFARYLVNNPHGYRSCAIYGYTACVSNYQPQHAWNKTDAVETMHKVVKLDSTHLKGVLTDLFTEGRTTLRRAKDVQLKIAENGRVLAT